MPFLLLNCPNAGGAGGLGWLRFTPPAFADIAANHRSKERAGAGRRKEAGFKRGM
jgi:hypothetical protein